MTVRARASLGVVAIALNSACSLFGPTELLAGAWVGRTSDLSQTTLLAAAEHAQGPITVEYRERAERRDQRPAHHGFIASLPPSVAAATVMA